MDYSTGATTWQSLVAFAEESSDEDNKIEEAYMKALELARKSLQPLDPNIGVVVTYLADFYVSVGRLDDAEQRYHQVLAFYEKIYGNEHMLIAMVLRNLAAVREKQGATIEAGNLRARAQAIFG